MTDNPKNSSDIVGDAIKSAGPRPEVSKEITQRVRGAVHAQWKADLSASERRTPRRGILWGAAAVVILAVSAIAVLVFDRGPDSQPSFARIQQIEADGTSSIGLTGGVDRPARLSVSESVRVGDSLTTQLGQRATIHVFGSDVILKVDQSTTLTVAETDLIELVSGRVYVDIGPDSALDVFRVQASELTIEHVGTQFSIEIRDGMTTARVREGEIRVTVEDEEWSVRPGTVLRHERGGTPVLARVASDGSFWEWTTMSDIAIGLTGLTLDEVLREIARREGLEVIYRSDAKESREIVLDGELVNVDAATAVDTLSRASGVNVRIELDQIIVGS